MADMAAGEVRAVDDRGGVQELGGRGGAELPSRPSPCSVKHSDAQS